MGLLCSQTAQASTTDAPPEMDLPVLRIELPNQTWEQLRHELPPQGWGPFGASCHPINHPFRYSWHEVTLVDEQGQRKPAELRKKAFCGSQSQDKPGLKLRYVTDTGRARRTLNNSHQDPSFLRQCLAYDLFNWAGLPSSTCRLVQVQINGSPPQIYVEVEGLRRSYAQRHGLVTDQQPWRRYEGTLSDLHRDWSANFEAKHRPAPLDPTGLELAELVWAVDQAGPLTADALSPHLDLEQWFLFWALEGLAGALDGYAINQNNFYLGYRSLDRRFVWMPWGTDHFFRHKHRALMQTAAWLPWRLAGEDWARERFCQASRWLLDEVWHEERILATIHARAPRIRVRLQGRERRRFAQNLADLQQFVRGRRAAVGRELRAICDGPVPTTPKRPAPEPPRAVDVGWVELNFEVDWVPNGHEAAQPLQPPNAPMPWRAEIRGAHDRHPFVTPAESLRVEGRLRSGKDVLLTFKLRTSSQEQSLMLQIPGLDLANPGAHRVDFTARAYGGILVTGPRGPKMVARLVDGRLTIERPVLKRGDRLQARLRARLLRVVVP